MRPYLQYSIAAGAALSVSVAGLVHGRAAPTLDATVSAQAANGARGPHAFYFTRGIYSSYRGGWGGGGRSWAIDYPKADLQFLIVLRRLTYRALSRGCQDRQEH